MRNTQGTQQTLGAVYLNEKSQGLGKNLEHTIMPMNKKLCVDAYLTFAGTAYGSGGIGMVANEIAREDYFAVLALLGQIDSWYEEFVELASSQAQTSARHSRVA